MQPIGLVGKLLEKMHNLPASPSSTCTSFPGIVAAVVAGNKMLSRINSNSILQPENREFLDKQGREPISPVFGIESMHFVRKTTNKHVNKTETPESDGNNKLVENVENSLNSHRLLRRTSSPSTNLSNLDNKLTDKTKASSNNLFFESDHIICKNENKKNTSLFSIVKDIKESKQKLMNNDNLTQDSSLEKYANDVTQTAITDVLNDFNWLTNNQILTVSNELSRHKSLIEKNLSLDFPDQEGDIQTDLASKETVAAARWQENLQVCSDCVASQHSFDLEEILSAPDDEVPMMIPGVEKKSLLGKLIRTSSTQSDSSGFGDSDVTETNIADSSCSGDTKIKSLQGSVKSESEVLTIDEQAEKSQTDLSSADDLVQSLVTDNVIDFESNELQLPKLNQARRPSSEVSVQEWLSLKREHQELIQQDENKGDVFLTVPKLKFDSNPDDSEDDDPEVEALIKILNSDDPYPTYKAGNFGPFWGSATSKQRAFQEVRLMQDALRRYKSQMKNVEVLSYSCYQPVYKILPVNIKIEVDSLSELCGQILEEVLEMERLLASKMKTIIGSDDHLPFVSPLRMLDVIGKMVILLNTQSDLLKEYKLEDYKASGRFFTSRNAWQIGNDLSQQLNVLRHDLQNDYQLNQETMKTFLDELKSSILKEIRKDFSLENARLKELLEVKEKEIRRLQKYLKLLKHESSSQADS